jgi:hypothetical protein
MSLLRTFLCAGLALGAVPSMAADQAAPSIPSDNGNLAGDHIKLATNVGGFVALPISSENTPPSLCATVGSTAAVSHVAGEFIFLRFLKVADKTDVLTFQGDFPAMEACSGLARVNTFTQYRIKATELAQYDFKRSGIAFGALVVPFKYRLGGAKELVSSATMAPFIGIRTALGQSWGLTFTPVVAAGLSLVPVVDATTKASESKAAYTLALGIRLTSSKNENFSAGLLYGRDFLNKSDRDADPNVSKPWVSFYLGYSL